MTDLVHGLEEIHVFMEHPIYELVEEKVKDIEPLEVLQLGVELLEVEVEHDQPLQVLDLEVVEVDDLVDYNGHASYYEDEVDYDGDDSDHYYNHATCEDDDHYNYDFHDNDDEFRQNNDDYRYDNSEFVRHDNEECENDNQDDPIEVDTKQFYSRRAGKEPVIEDQQKDPIDDLKEESSDTKEVTQKRKQNWKEF